MSLSDDKNSERHPGKEYLLKEVKRVAEMIGHPPTMPEYTKNTDYNANSLSHYFTNWVDVLEECGLEPTQEQMNRAKSQQPTERELIQELRAGAGALGRPPMSTEMAEFGQYNPKKYYQYFGSWGDALEAAELDPNNPELVAVRGFKIEDID